MPCPHAPPLKLRYFPSDFSLFQYIVNALIHARIGLFSLLKVMSTACGRARRFPIHPTCLVRAAAVLSQFLLATVRPVRA